MGQPIPGVEVKIAEDGEILTRGPHVMKGYYKSREATAEAIDADGWFHTGDIGVSTRDGFLVITDRKKDIIVTSGGKNIAPQPIENLLKTQPFIAEIVMIGNKRNFPAALVVPNFENLEKWAPREGVAFASREELIAHARGGAPTTTQLVRRADRATWRQFEQIKKIALLPSEFTHRGGRADADAEGEAPGGRAEVQGRHRPHVRGGGRLTRGGAREAATIRKVVVLGAGTMGAQVAAHLVGARAWTWRCWTSCRPDAADRSALAQAARCETLRKLKPSPLHLPEHAGAHPAGNFEDDWRRAEATPTGCSRRWSRTWRSSAQLFARGGGAP